MSGGGSAWSAPGTVAGFAGAAANPILMDYAERQRTPASRLRVLDIGCGAGRNAVPLTAAGAEVLGVDRSWPMLAAAAARRTAGGPRLACAAMDALPVPDRSFDLIVAHGIWNLARSGDELAAALNEAARAAAPEAALFVFTFSRRTLTADAAPVAGETVVFTQFSGEPQVFLTAAQLIEALAGVGFAPDPDLPLRELNVPAPGQLPAGAPVIYEGGFRRS